MEQLWSSVADRMGGGALERGQRTDGLPSYVGTKARAFEQT